MPLIATPIQAACRTESELTDAIAAAYKEYLVDPQITVTIRQFSSQVVNLVGAVQRPGSFQLQRRVRLRELVTIAGGNTATAGDTIMLVSDEHRTACEGQPQDSQQGVRMVNTAAMLAGNDVSNPYVMPGDFINVVEAEQAFVVGNVYKPSPIALAQPVSLTRALAIAGGQLPGSRNNIHIVRRANDGQNTLTVLKFDMKAILANKQEDPFLKPGDIVDVDVSITKALAKAMAGALATAGVVYYPLTFIR